MPDRAIYVGRGTPWGNPFTIASCRVMSGPKAGNREWMVEGGSGVWFRETEAEAHALSVQAFRAWIDLPSQSRLRDLVTLGLKGRDLACWCKPGLACHADVLLELANS